MGMIMKIRASFTWLAVGCSLLAGHGMASAAELAAAKAELMGRVEHYFLNNSKGVLARKSLEWGEVETATDGNRSIRYQYEAPIRDKDMVVMNQVFTFDPAGNFVSLKSVEGFPKPKTAKPADTTTQAGMKELVEDFFQHNFRDVKARESLEWDEVTKGADGNSSIRYRYRARIWDKNTVTNDQVFTFEPGGKFVSVKEARAK
jgi:hypothetical protein